jgi:hypothetical protein
MGFFKQLLRDVVTNLENRVEVSNPAKVVGNDVINGDVNILQLAIYKNQVAFDIKSQVTEIHIFESIVSPVIYCTMTVADAINLQDDFKIDIGTLIRFEFQTPGTSQSTEYFFQCNRVFNKRDVPGLTMKVYTVELVSVEAAAAQNINMEGFVLNETSGVLIEKIMKEKVFPKVGALNDVRQREQKLEIDSGHGVIAKNNQQIRSLSNNRKPFEVIHQLALLTNKSPEGYSLHTFFEDKDGYQFKPLEKLMSDGRKLLRNDQSDAIFFYDHVRNQNQSAVKFRNILAYNVSSSDNLTEGRGGGVNTHAVITNPQTGENSAEATPIQDKNITDLTSIQALRSFDEATRQEIITSTEYDHLNETLVSRRQLLLRISQFEAQVLIYGDTNITVGNVIECNFPRSISTSRESSDPESGSELSADSGYYLITHLRHIILNTDRPQHIISSNLMRAEPVRS